MYKIIVSDDKILQEKYSQHSMVHSIIQTQYLMNNMFYDTYRIKWKFYKNQAIYCKTENWLGTKRSSIWPSLWSKANTQLLSTCLSAYVSTVCVGLPSQNVACVTFIELKKVHNYFPSYTKQHFRIGH
jgi:hypothetical protein